MLSGSRSLCNRLSLCGRRIRRHFYYDYVHRHTDGESGDTQRLICYRVRNGKVTEDDDTEVGAFLIFLGFKVFAVARFLSAVVFLAVLATLISRSLDQSHLVFRASDSVAPHEMPSILYQIRPRVEEYLRVNPNECGLAAPNLQLYKQYLVLRHEAALIDVFNPSFVPTGWMVNSTQKESSSMCKDKFVFEATRSYSISMTYRTAGNHESVLELSHVQAWCVQHFVDVFKGTWMCDPGIPSVLRIPAVVASRYKDEN